jgi:pilus assembly protein CpaE
MTGARTTRENGLTALLIAPDRELAQAFLSAVGETRAFHVLGDLKSYPARNTLDIRLRQVKPAVVLIDLGTDPTVASDLIQFIAGLKSPVQVVALHKVNDSATVVAALRLGASEFLYAPFEPSQQRDAVARLRRLRPAEENIEPRMGKVIVFCSAKPGSGASTLATHSAHAIRKLANKRVLLLDLDMESGTIAFYLKLQPNYSAVDALEQAQHLDAGLWSALCVNAGGLDVLAAPDAPFLTPVDPARLHELLDYARMLYDWVIVDCPVVFQRTTLIAISESDQAYIVSTPDLASLHLARKAANLLTQLGFPPDRFDLLINRMGKGDGISGADMAKIFSRQVHTVLPNDYFSVHRVISLGQALSPDCDLGKSIAALAVKVTGAAQGGKKPAETAPAAVRT